MEVSLIPPIHQLSNNKNDVLVEYFSEENIESNINLINTIAKEILGNKIRIEHRVVR